MRQVCVALENRVRDSTGIDSHTLPSVEADGSPGSRPDETDNLGTRTSQHGGEGRTAAIAKTTVRSGNICSMCVLTKSCAHRPRIGVNIARGFFDRSIGRAFSQPGNSAHAADSPAIVLGNRSVCQPREVLTHRKQRT
jgi:hypothetical protein